ncbi:MAG: hypothetical protein E7E36_04275 [Veillonella sp.]|nr:hypothetical protein [Veillonella sp.]
MCLAVPAQLVAVNDVIGTVELTGATRVDEEEAQKTLEAFKELEELEEAYFAGKAEQC